MGETLTQSLCSGDCDDCTCGAFPNPADPLDEPHTIINGIIANNDVLDKGKISDGFHSFNDLYTHRCTLFIALCKAVRENEYVWRSRRHSDGSQWAGWFILGIGTIKGQQITYHLPESMWEACSFAAFRELAPQWDGHTADDVLKRLLNL